MTCSIRDNRLRALACLLTGVFVSALACAQGPTSPSATGEPDYATLSKAFDRFSGNLEKLKSQIDQTKFSPDALIDKLDYDAAALIDFVTGTVVFQPYDGLMRGTAGTLHSRAGNSLDQAILLAYLLKSAGFDARIVRGQLSDADASRLVRNMGMPPRADTLAYLEDEMKQLGVAAPADSASASDAHAAALAAGITRQLAQSLDAGKIGLRPYDVTGTLDQLARTYFWVQYRDGAAQGWQDAHPAFGKLAAPTGVKPQEYFAASIPRKYQHTLTISAWIEQFQLGKIIAHRIMSDWTRPVANLQGVVLSFRNFPLNMNKDNAGDLARVMSAADIFLPMLNNARAPGAMAFDLKGRTIDPMALSGGGGGLFETLGNALESATGDLHGNDNGQPVLALHSMWIEFDFNSPGAKTTRIRRYVVPPRTDHATDPEAIAWALINDHNYLTNTGSEPLDYVADRYLATAIENNNWLQATLARIVKPGKEVPFPKQALPADFQPLAEYWLMDSQPAADAKLVSFRASPSLIGIRRGFRDADTAFTAVDVAAHRIEHLRLTDSGIEAVPAASLARGVWDTVVEALPGRFMSNPGSAENNTMHVFDLARQQGIATRLVPVGKVNMLQGLKVSATAKRFMQQDLQSGFAIITPQRRPDGVALTGWWRIDPVTGETLGMTADGYGQDLVEYLTDTVSMAFNMVQALQSLKKCDELDNNVAKMCCLVEANINNVAGLGMGSLMGATVGSAGAALFDIVNYGTTAATEKISGEGVGLMPTANLGCKKMQATSW